MYHKTALVSGFPIMICQEMIIMGKYDSDIKISRTDGVIQYHLLVSKIRWKKFQPALC